MNKITVVNTRTDQELVTLLAGGDESAFAEIFKRYRSRLYRFALRFCKSPTIAEELTHDTFLKIWTGRNELDQVTHFGTYLFTIARNKALNHLRSIAREERMKDQLYQSLKEGHNDTVELLEANESSRLVQEAVGQLSPQRKLIYALSREEGLNHEQIADKLGLSKSTVNNHLTESLKQIRAYLGKHSPEALLVFTALTLFR
ncbi:MAG TPA: RNA polymerase sigma-70 factor [Mucilaginibacter sp.]|nr:RNA polymerase sigma-70 factor [Mucilaginibacter sp.]